MTKPNARSRAANAHRRTATGGRTRWTFRFCTGIPALSDPMGKAFDYAKEFKTLDLNAVDQGPARVDDGIRRNGGRPISVTMAA